MVSNFLNIFRKRLFYLFNILFLNICIAQPKVPPRPFEDSYTGRPDFNIKLGKVKTQLTYYHFENAPEAILYTERNYNKKGFLLSQKWYNLLSKKAVYWANYEYNENDSLKSCFEKMSKECDHFNTNSMKIDNNFQPMGDPIDGVIPVDGEGNTVVKTIYQSGQYGGYVAKKYFYDGSFYKEKICNFLDYGFTAPYGIFINKNKTIDLDYDKRFFFTDTIYQSADTIIFYLKTPENDKTYGITYFKILKVKSHNEFVISEIERFKVTNQMKLRFSYQGRSNTDHIDNEIQSITYSDNYTANSKLILEHRIEFLDTVPMPLIERVELNEMYNKLYFFGTKGGLYYSFFKNGSLYNEVHYAISDDVEKLRSIKYQRYNLVDEKVFYPAAYKYEEFSQSFDYNEKGNVKEINRYIYFDD